ncbi:MAG: hypothetical protein LBM08_14365, partial [Dysgonamonadaceae bacterium]|nr:hypothetical protein [Dysgonamonadaceae bacterium]
MKQKNLSNRRMTSTQIIRLCLIASMLLTSLFQLQAQRIVWTTSSVSPASVAVLGDTATIDLDFNVAEDAVANAKVEAVLPANVVYRKTETGAGHTAGNISASQSENTVSVTFTGNNLNVSDRVHLQIKTTVGDCNFTLGTVDIRVLSNNNPVNMGTATATINAHKPDIRLTTTSNSASLTTPVTDKANFTTNISVTNGTARSLKVTYTVDQYTFLDNFKLGATTISADADGTNSKTYTLILPDEIFSSVAKQLTFTAYSNRSGSRTITTAFQYPSGSNCVSGTGPSFTVIYPAVSGIPKMRYYESTPLRRSYALNNIVPSSDLNVYDFPMDGITPCYEYITFENYGETNAYDVVGWFTGNRDGRVDFAYSYIEGDGIRYFITSNGTNSALKTPLRITGNNLLNSTGSNGVYRTLKPEIEGKKYSNYYVYVNEEDVIAPNDRITFIVPVYEGNTYDNSARDNTPLPSTLSSSVPRIGHQWFHYQCSAKNANGTDGTSVRSYNGGWKQYSPYFTNSILPLLVRPGQTGEITQTVNTTGGLNSEYQQSISIYFKLPDWLELNGEPSSALSYSGTGTPTIASHGDNTYSVTTYEEKGTLTIRYKATTDQVNAQDNIRYWINWNLGHTSAISNSAYRPVLEKIATRTQPARLMGAQDGIVLDALSLYRITRGLKDTNNDGVPDAIGVLAPDNEIDHYRYRFSDEGNIIIEGKIANITSEKKYFYVIVDSTDFNLGSDYINLQTATLEKGTKPGDVFNSTGVISANIVPVRSNNRYYLKHETKDSWNDGDYFRLTIPFKLRNAGAGYDKNINVEAYLSDENITAPADIYNPEAKNINRYGGDMVTNTITIIAPNIYTTEGEGSHVFSSITPYYYPLMLLRDVYLAMSWVKEFRPSIKPKKLELTCPNGYVFLNGGEMTLKDSVSVNLTTNNNSALNEDITMNPSQVDTLSNGIKYTYEFPNLFDDFDESTKQISLNDNKWILSPGRFWYYFYVNVQPTREASSQAATVANKVYYDNLITGALNTGQDGNAKSLSLNNVPSLNLLCSTSEIQAYGTQLSIPSLSIGIVNISAANIWLYVDGNVSNISAKNNISTQQFSGTGYQGRWINLGSASSGFASDYALTFDHGNAVSCAGDVITVYTVCDFGGSFTPDLTAAIDPLDYDHNG